MNDETKGPNEEATPGEPVSPSASQNTAAETAPGEIPKEERMWAMLCHLGALCGFIIPFGNIIAPLVIWLVKKDEMAFVADQGKEALNFQITLLIAFFVCFILMFILIGIFLMYIVAIGALVMVIIAAIKANEGQAYRYPFAIRLIK